MFSLIILSFIFLIPCRPDGEINIYREGHKIVQAFNPNPLDVNYVSLGCLDSDAMDYYYNCRENDEFDESDQLNGDLFAYAGTGVYYSRSVPQISSCRLVVMNVIFYLIVFFLWQENFEYLEINFISI